MVPVVNVASLTRTSYEFWCFICMQAGPGQIGTELLMEPQHGHVWVEHQQGTKDGGHGRGSCWMSDEVGCSDTSREKIRVLLRTRWFLSV